MSASGMRAARPTPSEPVARARNAGMRIQVMRITTSATPRKATISRGAGSAGFMRPLSLRPLLLPPTLRLGHEPSQRKARIGIALAEHERRDELADRRTHLESVAGAAAHEPHVFDAGMVSD